jgi:uncharacterized protein YecT (DUF1311 family)
VTTRRVARATVPIVLAAVASIGLWVPPPANAVPGVRALVPALHETFTLLPCSPSTTLGLEGCAEHRVIAADRRVDQLRQRVATRLATPAARRDFRRVESTWVRYRQRLCTLEATSREGGSLAPVVVAQCLARVDLDHLRDLRALLDAFAP